MSLRDTFRVLNRDYHLRVFQPNCHPIYVMVLLRIADYVQLQSTRAPKRLLKIKRLKSPLSQSEWGLHDAIQGVSFDAEPDPEVLHVQVDPRKSDIESYLKTQRLLDSIQRELDKSWAVLGEIYGRFQNENWGITIRRIRSNIEERDNFGRAAGFIPEEVKFTSANTELTKLLIKPLYGDYPEIAVRELVQNAIDACREKAFSDGAKTDEELAKYTVRVEILNNSDGTTTLRVSDTGIGMTLDVLKRYFLNAGSSFRTSLAWKKQFANDKSKSEVLRSGRFGVGALAAFLVADDPSEIRLSVLTRHAAATADEAVGFETTLSDSPISVNFKHKAEVGSVISVTTSSPPSFMRSKESEEKEGASWDWYCLDWPRVERSLSTGKVLPQKYRLPTSITKKEIDGVRTNFVQVEGFESVCWYYGEGHPVVCNGIRVIKKENYRSVVPDLFKEETVIGTHVVGFPNISVMDRDGLLPLTLDRLRLDFDQVPFMRELREDVLLSLVCGLAVSAPKSISKKSFELSQKTLKAIAGNFQGLESSSISWIIANDRVAPFSGRSINLIKGMRIIELSNPGDLKYVKNPSEHALILTDKSIYGSQRSGTNPGKHLHFLSDGNARDRLDRTLHYVHRDLEEEYERERYIDRRISDKEINSLTRDFISSIKSVLDNRSYRRHFHSESIINHLEHRLDDYEQIHAHEYQRFSKRIFHEIYDAFGGHHILGELLHHFERKQHHSPLDGRDGRRLADAIAAIADATPRLKENVSKDYNDENCPVDWGKLKRSLSRSNDDWFLASWVLHNSLEIETGFIGDAWHKLFGTDFIPLSDSDRNMLFGEFKDESQARIHLNRWMDELKTV
ncbi:MAG: ATP-binding protein [Candidatus Thiodiazotropha endolucinida]|nr:ATP-binding protein [Candidatus Thiodiazotropha endolucinida]